MRSVLLFIGLFSFYLARSQTVVISQVYGGGGNLGATFKNDFIELFNASAAPVSLAGWSVQYAGGNSDAWLVTPLSGTINAGQYLLIRESTGGPTGSQVNNADIIGSINLGTSKGKIALVNTTMALTGYCPSGATIIDLIGYGTGTNCFEGINTALTPTVSLSLLRAGTGCQDNNQNASDFSLVTPAPRNRLTPLNICMINSISLDALSTTSYSVDCNNSAVGTVDFSSTGVFAAGNFYEVQLSDAVGSFTNYAVIGSLTTVANSGNISFIIPQALKAGAAYRIRIKSSNPAVISNSSGAINVSAPLNCPTDPAGFFKSAFSGNWNQPGKWEFSSTGLNGTWRTATLSPTPTAKQVRISNGTVISLIFSQNADEVVIENGGTLVNDLSPGNVFTIENGPGYDLDIQYGGNYNIISSQSYPAYQFLDPGATVNVATGGKISIGNGGSMSTADHALIATTPASYIWHTGSIFDWNSTTVPISSATVFFPDADVSTWPIFRFSVSPSGSIGGGLPILVKGVLEANANLDFNPSANRIFRNGITGTGNLTMSAGVGSFIINGAEAELGGTGRITPNYNGLLVGQTGLPCTATLSSSKHVYGDLVLEDHCYVQTEDHSLRVEQFVLTTTTDSYVRTNGKGHLVMNLGSGSLVLYAPVGQTSLNPVFLDYDFADMIFTIRVEEPINPPIYNDNQAVLKTWYIAADFPGHAFINFGYQYPSDTGPFYSNTGPNSSVGVYIGGTWHVHEQGITPVTYPWIPGLWTVNTSNVTYFTNLNAEIPFVVANNGAILPLDFSLVAQAKKQGSDGLISWNILDAAAFTKFELERSVDGGPYNTIATMNTTLSLDYAITDHLLSPGVNTYRIKGIRNTGAIKYSNIVAIINGSKGLLLTSLYPNPARDRVFVNVSAANTGQLEWEIRNTDGLLMRSWQQNVVGGNSRVEVPVCGLSAGVYFIAVKDQGMTGILKFVKQ